jgi:hypothetical protein
VNSNGVPSVSTAVLVAWSTFHLHRRPADFANNPPPRSATQSGERTTLVGAMVTVGLWLLAIVLIVLSRSCSSPGSSTC